jgi:hypothetical protein
MRMNINEIQTLVQLIEGTKDDAVKSILRKLLATWVEKEGMMTDQTYPWKIPEPITTQPGCPKCGLVLSGAMSYSCPHGDCPTGLGPVMCGVVNYEERN